MFPAYRKFADFLHTEYDPKGRTELAIESLADGKRRYAEAVKTMTTVNVPPAEVHEIGLKEVERVATEMTKLAQSQGYKDLASFREAVNNDPKWKPTSEQQILDDYKKYIHQMEPKLPELFGLAAEVASDSGTDPRLRQSRRDPLRPGYAGRKAFGPRRCGGL